MCVAIPGQVTNIKDKVAKADFMGISRDVSLELIENINVGDYILVHAGYAIEKISQENAQETIQIFESLREFVQDE